MRYTFIDDNGTFQIKSPLRHSLYFPLTNRDGTLLGSISPNLSGDLKRNNNTFLTPPASIEDLRSNLICRRDFFIQTSSDTLRLSRDYGDTLEAGFLYHKLIKKAKPFHIEIINFIPHNFAAEVMWIRLGETGYVHSHLVHPPLRPVCREYPRPPPCVKPVKPRAP